MDPDAARPPAMSTARPRAVDGRRRPVLALAFALCGSLAACASPTPPAETPGVARDAVPVASAAPAVEVAPTPPGDAQTGTPSAMTRPRVGLYARWRDPSIRLRVPILMYHVVGPQPGHELPDLVVPTARFWLQMELLHASGWHTITMAELADDLAEDRPPPPRTFVLTFDDGHRDGLTIVTPILRRLGYVATFYVILDRLARRHYLTGSDLRTLAADGMDIGNHTWHHLDLATLSPRDVAREVLVAERAIGRMAGYPPVTLAYPSGERTAATESEVARLGMDLAVTTVYGALETWADRLDLPRLRVHPDTTPSDLLLRMQRLAD